MKILVTGGAGFIASHLVDALVDRADDVIVIDNLSTGDRRNLNPEARFFELDIRDPAAAEMIRRERPQAISHHAAQMSVSRSVAEPVFDAEVNVLGSLNLTLAAIETQSRVVFASTGGALYGDAAVIPTPETAPAWPGSPCGISNPSFENYLFGLHRTRRLTHPAQPPHPVQPPFLLRARGRLPLHLNLLRHIPWPPCACHRTR